MARTDALKKLQKTLTARRNELRRRLQDDLKALRTADSPDTVTAAAASMGEELASQLAALEARELGQIEQALARIKQGKYGLCAACACKIPVARLNALPYSVLCIGCQREAEKDATWLEDRITETWGDGESGDDASYRAADVEYSFAK
jgi:DnaK suppressor protein